MISMLTVLFSLIGGILTSFLQALLVWRPLYATWKWR